MRLTSESSISDVALNAMNLFGLRYGLGLSIAGGQVAGVWNAANGHILELFTVILLIILVRMAAEVARRSEPRSDVPWRRRRLSL